MNTIKINVRCNEYSNTTYYKEFDVVEELPTIDLLDDLIQWKSSGIYAVEEMQKDCEQPTFEADIAECYELKYFNSNNYSSSLDEGLTAEEALEEATNIEYVAIIGEW